METALSLARPPRPLSFHGHDLDANTVLSVEPIDSHSTGTMNCQWNYGFKVNFPGNSILILQPKPNQYGYSGGPSRAQYLDAAAKLRAEFLRVLWPE